MKAIKTMLKALRLLLGRKADKTWVEDTYLKKTDTPNVTVPVPDWDINDPDEGGYIKNRIAYTETTELGTYKFVASTESAVVIAESDSDAFRKNVAEVAKKENYDNNNKDFYVTVKFNGVEDEVYVYYYYGTYDEWTILGEKIRIERRSSTDFTMTCAGMTFEVGKTYEATFQHNIYHPIKKQLSPLQNISDGESKGSVVMAGAKSNEVNYSDNTYYQIAEYGVAEGKYSRVNGEGGHAEGNSSSSGLYSHAEGGSQANGDYSHSEGRSTANGENSHSGGRNCVADGECSFACGFQTEAKGDYSHAEGYYTIALDHQNVRGRNNIEDAPVTGNDLGTLESATYTTTDGKTAYNFTKASDGYYTSANKGIVSSVSYGKVKFNFSATSTKVVIVAISYGEKNGDYGIISELDKDLPISNVGGYTNTLYSFYNKNASEEPRYITINVPKGQHYITFKYIKNTSVDKNGDYFKIRFCAHTQGSHYADIVGNGQYTSTRSNAYALKWNGDAFYAGNVYANVEKGLGSNAKEGNKLVTNTELETAVNPKLDAPTTATTGQVIAVKTVDEDGKITEVEAVDMSGGSGGTPNAVQYVAQSLTDKQKAQARTNIGAGTSSFSGSYNDLTDAPEGYTLPVASADELGGVKPAAKTDAMTSAVGVDADGKLWSAAGGGEWELIAHIDVAADVANNITQWVYSNLPRYKYIAYKKINLKGSTETESGCSININGNTYQPSGISYAKNNAAANGHGLIYVMPFGWGHIRTGDANSPTNYAMGGLSVMYNTQEISDNAITSIAISGNRLYQIASGEIWLYGKKG